MPVVYAAFGTDVIHEGHLNILQHAREYGTVIVGALSDKALIRYSRFPTVSQEERVKLYESLEGVSRVVVQDDYLYDEVIATLKPDYVVHGDNWQNGPERAIRDNIEALLATYGGTLIEVPYTRSEQARKVDRQLREKLAMPEYRRRRLRQLLAISPTVKVIEAHDGLTGLIAEKTVVDHNGRLDQFDGMWVSSLCDSTERGKPDIELVDMSARLRTIDDIMEVTTKPIILDGDTGGLTEHFVYNVRTLERMGVSAVIIEDKTGLKKNSLFGTEVKQTQAPIEDFCAKISAGKKVQLTDDFMIIARIESLILERGMEDALTRAFAFKDAGADGIMIHSRKKDPAEIYEFCDRFREKDSVTPIVVVPTSFNSATEEELASHGINIVIYANQLIRAAFPAMQETARGILKAHRALEVDEQLLPFKDIIRLIDEL
ncbi:phosphoenolpyruvate mutase [Atopobium sp. oral taxon 199]|uniref:phosphoenolpyruvate mutase n=1 Tax=Atopobium sp. oral taxon 199 TaxID=712156 RepID=UPI00034E85A7|nr:phosphoenolpyruvate mutase [Atopobium sp. oral taxon 199]EPD78835.1 phosphoenolpyruvate phosphomutase [Atopobium sp. oral taxon 199 str. F0494]